MSTSIYSVITGTGKYIPPKVVTNADLTDKIFYDTKGARIEKEGTEILEKFKAITTIAERRYVSDDLMASDIAYFAAKDALESAGVDGETLDYIIVAHNFGDIKHGSNRTDIVPTLAARVKHKLQIKNPECVAYDVPFGCPGWLQALIQADYYIKSGDAKRILVIGTDTLSRVFDPYDRDSLLYSDGAGATILEAKESETPIGVLAHKTRSDTYIHSQMLFMGKAYHDDEQNEGNIYLKM
ncbi:MAG: 3-oxoacyl-ACP synthase III family protein, partial [Saprospiraceae bacterium]